MTTRSSVTSDSMHSVPSRCRFSIPEGSDIGAEYSIVRTGTSTTIMFSNTAHRFVESFSAGINSSSFSGATDELILGLPSTSTFSDLPISVIDIPKSASGRPKRRASSRIRDFVAAEVQLRKDSSKHPKSIRTDVERINERLFARDKLAAEVKSSLESSGIDESAVKSEDIFPCCYCDTACPKLEQLEEHILTHVKPLPHVCTVCQHSFSARETLTKHMASHSKQRKFSCPLCSMAFSQKGKLKLHLRTHSGERPYKCTQNHCTYAAAQKGNLTVHLRAVHRVQ